MNKVYWAFWTCESTFVKTWGLKPMVVHYIYTMVIRSILTYSSLVQWARGRYSVSRTDISKLQRLACLAIMGDEDNPNSCNGGPPGTSSSSCDDLGWKPSQGFTDKCAPNSGDLNPLTSVTQKNLGIWSWNQSYRWDVTGCN